MIIYVAPYTLQRKSWKSKKQTSEEKGTREGGYKKW